MPTVYVAGLTTYDGSEYHGFQYQVGLPTIQGAMEKALLACTGVAIRIVGAGRTDSGVHARGQVVAAHVPWRHGVDALQRAWNAHLPPAIVVRQLRPAVEDFHPRFSAQGRTYIYRVCQGVAGSRSEPIGRSPLTDRYALYASWTLDVEAMNQASAYLVGEHDFAAFGQATQGESTVRAVWQAEWREVAGIPWEPSGWPGRHLVFIIQGSGFLRRMVRNIVGSLLEVGRGTWQQQDVAQVLASKERHRSAAPAPARGRVLEQVFYPTGIDPFSEKEQVT